MNRNPKGNAVSYTTTLENLGLQSRASGYLITVCNSNTFKSWQHLITDSTLENKLGASTVNFISLYTVWGTTTRLPKNWSQNLRTQKRHKWALWQESISIFNQSERWVISKLMKPINFARSFTWGSFVFKNCSLKWGISVTGTFPST